MPRSRAFRDPYRWSSLNTSSPRARRYVSNMSRNSSLRFFAVARASRSYSLATVGGIEIVTATRPRFALILDSLLYDNIIHVFILHPLQRRRPMCAPEIDAN